MVGAWWVCRWSAAWLLFAVAVACGAQGAGQATAVPGKGAVLQALGYQALAQEGAVEVRVKPWGGHAGSFVALAWLTAANDMDLDGTEAVRSPRLQPTVALLESPGGRLVVVARLDGAGGLGKPCRELAHVTQEMAHEHDGSGRYADGTLCKGFALDLAAYRITAGEVALGVRTRLHEIYPAGESDSEDLTLLTVSGRSLQPVWSETMSDSAEERGPNEMLTTKATLAVSAAKTGEHFDLVLTESDRTDKLVSDGAGGHPGRVLRRRRFVWNGSVYAEKK